MKLPGVIRLRFIKLPGLARSLHRVRPRVRLRVLFRQRGLLRLRTAAKNTPKNVAKASRAKATLPAGAGPGRTKSAQTAPKDSSENTPEVDSAPTRR
jgi:hypothetical protein